MTVSSTTATQTFACDGVTTAFTCPFRVLSTTEMRVYLVTIATGASALLTNGVDYTVSNAGTAANAIVTTATTYSNAYRLKCKRRTSRLQETDYRDNDPFPAESHETLADRQIMIAQELDEDLSRAILAPDGETLAPLPPATERALKIVGFDSAGGLVVVVPSSGSAASLALLLASTANASEGDAMVGVKQPYAGAVARTQHDKNLELVSVKDFGAVGDGVADDLPAMEAARDAAATASKTLYFPDGTYGISDTFYFADGGHAFFAPGAKLKLLNATSTGGAVSGPYPTQTKPIQIHNLTVDCNSIAGENAGGFGNIVNARLFNPRFINVLHDAVTFGGKALQFEGTAAKDVQVFNPSFENCSVGIDIGVHSGAQAVHIGIFNATMSDVDIPVYVNDTTTTTPSGSLDQVEVLIDGLQCRNCGKLTWGGATATGGGIIVSDRGFRLTVLGVQVANDRGGYGSTAYGTIGALVRGQGQGITLGDVLIDADMVALFDHNPASFQSPFAGDIASYVFTDRVRHYGNLDYVVKCLGGGNKLGASLMRGIEIGSTLATLAGLVDANAAAYSNAKLEVINRDNSYLSSGLKSLSELNALGNALNGSTQGLPAVAQMAGSWTPIDASGAALPLSSAAGWWFRMGDMVVCIGHATYPATANGANAVIGGLPFTVRNVQYARDGCVLTVSSLAAVKRIYALENTVTAPLLSDVAAAVTNAQCSTGTFSFLLIYPVTL